jgi:osmotically-inducible protein OsmY
MDDRNRSNQYDRQDRSRNRNQYRDTPDYYGSRQAEQFDDGNSYSQDSDWSQNDRYDRQYGDSRPTSGSYAAGDYGRSSSQSGSGYGAAGSYGRSDRGNYGGNRYDNGMSYYTSESQGGRDFSRNRSDYGTRSDYDRNRSYDRTGNRGDGDRGFFERAGDEIASWFGDEDAARRRKMDHRGNGPSGYTRSDERVLEDACDRLTEDWDLDARNIQVTVSGGEVTLDGTVDNRGAKRRAEDIVHDVSGVGHVQNNLRVQNRTSRDWNASDRTTTADRTLATDTTGTTEV